MSHEHIKKLNIPSVLQSLEKHRISHNTSVKKGKNYFFIQWPTA